MFARAEWHAMRSIRLSVKPNSQRCVATKTPPPKPAYTGFTSAFTSRVRAQAKQKPESEKISLVPKVDEQGIAIKQAEAEADTRVEKGVITQEEFDAEQRAQQEQDKRIRQFEQETKGKQHLSPADLAASRAREHGGGRFSQKVFGQMTDNTTYPRDVLTFSHKKPPVSYKIDVYKSNCCSI
jgi:hypothetical protein